MLEHRAPYVFVGTLEEAEAALPALRGVSWTDATKKTNWTEPKGAAFPAAAKLHITLPHTEFEAWVNPYEIDLVEFCKKLARTNGVYFKASGEVGKADMYSLLPRVQVIPDEIKPRGAEPTKRGEVAGKAADDEDLVATLNALAGSARG
mgnify:CR=1 FL=1